MFGFWLVVLAVAGLLGLRRTKRRIRLLYREQPLVRGDYAVFPSCGCRYDLGGTQERELCQAHQTIIDAEVAA